MSFNISLKDNMNVFFDLDGTLIDSRMRLYQLFNDLTSQSLLSFDEYWDLKRSMNTHDMILKERFNWSQTEIDTFVEKWMSLIEDESYLELDALFPFTVEVLQKLKQKSMHLYIVTSRQFKGTTINQLKNLGIYDYFHDVLITEAKKTKVDLIRESGIDILEKDVLIGDTGVDIKTAKDLKIQSVAVLTGFRNKDILQKYNPNNIVTDIRGLINYV